MKVYTGVFNILLEDADQPTSFAKHPSAKSHKSALIDAHYHTTYTVDNSRSCVNACRLKESQVGAEQLSGKLCPESVSSIPVQSFDGA